VLVERLVRRVFDRNGRCWQRVTHCRPVAPAEYDAHCAAADAAAGGPAGRPPGLRWSLGDRRTGAQLLGEAAADRRLTLARLRGSRRGRGWLGQLAAEVRRRFAPRVRAAAAAAAADPGLEAWARGLAEQAWPPPPPPSPSGVPHDGGGECAGGAGAAAARRPSAAASICAPADGGGGGSWTAAPKSGGGGGGGGEGGGSDGRGGGGSAAGAGAHGVQAEGGRGGEGECEGVGGAAADPSAAKAEAAEAGESGFRHGDGAGPRCEGGGRGVVSTSAPPSSLPPP
jgi:hypothetical protein